MTSVLDQLREMTVVVADTGEVAAVKKYKPIDCTTNPSLVLAALKDPASEALIAREIEAGRKAGKSAADVTATLTVAVGAALSELVPGRVSTEVDANLSFAKDASLARARAIIADYAARGIGKDRILIKIASTWEGIRAAEILQKEGIDCNLTLLFSMAQAVACADAGVFLISPFVGRITDWYKKAAGPSWDEAAMAGANDPGVRSVRRIYEHYKRFGIATEVMGASFRNVGQITALAGCDLLTIAPELMAQLAANPAPLARALDAEAARRLDLPAVQFDEAGFRLALNQDAMATEKLAEGIRVFIQDAEKLEALMQTA